MDPNIWLLVLAINGMTFLVYGLDKWKAKRKGKRQSRRIPEAWLLGLAFFTGVIGAWVGMSVFRHKTQKRSFRWKLIGVSLINPLWLLVYLQFSR